MLVLLSFYHCFSWIYTVNDSYKKENDYYKNKKIIL